jgi:hypothetical protein
MRLRSLSACFAALATLLQAACGTVNQGPTMAKTPPSRAADEVAVWMMGNYSSSAQAKSDPENFKSVVLHIAPIWVERIDGRWLYMEQAMADTPDKPYRQRVYRIMDEADGVENMVFELPGDPLRFAGAWKDTPLRTGVSGLYSNHTSSKRTSPARSGMDARCSSSSSSVFTERSSWMRSSPANASVICVPMEEIWMRGATIAPT